MADFELTSMTTYVAEIRETGYVTPCLTPLGREIFGEGDNAAQKTAKGRLCASCLVGLECFTDGMNEMLGGGRVPNKNYHSGFRAGLSSRQLLEVAQVQYQQGVRHLSLDNAEPVYLSNRPPKPKK